MSNGDPPARRPAARWQTGAPAGAGPAGPSRGTRRFVAVAALLAAIGAVVGALTYIRPHHPPLVLTLPVVEYTDAAWPPNPWAEEDSDALVAAFKAAAPDAKTEDKAYGSQEADLFRAWLRNLAGTDPAKHSAVVVHLSALAAVSNGAVYVLPADAHPGKSNGWVALADVLDNVGQCKVPNKLLLLDISHPIADPLTGIFADAAPDLLHTQLAALDKNGNLPFLVLTSCGPGEVSQPLDEEQLSAFAFYVVEGLRGAADGYPGAGVPGAAGSPADGRVTAKELAAYVAGRVTRWARECRDRRQMPTLYGHGPDFALASKAVPPGEPPADRPYPDWLRDRWKARDDWFKDDVHRTAPGAFNLLAAALPRSQAYWLASGRPERVDRARKPLRDAENAAKADRARAAVAPPPPLRSVAAWNPPPAPADWPAMINTYLDAVTAADRAAAADKAKETDKANAARQAFADKAKATDDTRKAAAKLVWQRLADDPAPEQARVAALSGLLDAVQPPDPGTTEAAAARRLATWWVTPDQRPPYVQWPRAGVRAFLRAEDAAGRALAKAPAEFPWAANLFAAAATRKADGERKLFDARTDNDQEAAEQVLKGATDDFSAAGARLTTVQAARRAVEDAAVVLHASVVRAADDGGSALKDWQTAAAAAGDLAGWLEKEPDAASPPQADWDTARDRLTAPINALRADDQPAVVKRALAAAAGGKAADYQALRALLRRPLVPGPDRPKAWDAARKLGTALHQQVRAADEADDAARRAPAQERSAPAPLAFEADRRDRRTRVAAGLLRAAGVDDLRAVEAARAAARADDTPAKWEAAEDALRAARAGLTGQARDRREKRQWAAADRRERYLPPVEGDRPAAAELRLLDRAAYVTWLAGYYQSLGALRPESKDFYDRAAEECGRPAG